MKIRMILFVAGAAAFAVAGRAPAQQTRAAQAAQRAFVDANGDGINDLTPLRSRTRTSETGSTYREQRREMIRELTKNLNSQQRAEVAAVVETQRRENATPEAMNEAVAAKLQSFGVVVPDAWHKTQLEVEGGFTLTQQQRREVAARRESLKSEGKSPAEVRAAVTNMVKAYGVAVSETQMAQIGRQIEEALSGADTETEVEALTTGLRQGIRAQSRLRTALRQMTATRGGGVQPPVRNGPPQTSVSRTGMTSAQLAQIRSLIETMQAQGKTIDEIRSAVTTTMNGYGVQPPPKGKGR